MDKDDRYTRITLRIPKDLHSKLSDAADETSKSMNAEIIARLEESFASTEIPPGELSRDQALKLLNDNTKLVQNIVMSHQQMNRRLEEALALLAKRQSQKT